MLVTLMSILHYALGLRFGNFKVSKTREPTTTSSFFYTLHSVIKKKILAFFLHFPCNCLAVFSSFFLRFHSCYGYQHVIIKNANENERKNPKREKNILKNARKKQRNGSAIRP